MGSKEEQGQNIARGIIRLCLISQIMLFITEGWGYTDLGLWCFTPTFVFLGFYAISLLLYIIISLSEK